MNSPQSFYWFDFETFGTDPARDRPAQFAGVRTDQHLNLIEEPLMLFAKPADDCLPHPEACLLTGITPQQCIREGIPEAEFMKRIQAALGRPGTCGVGYNSIRFDDEFIRHGLYRNFYDPYAREWQGGNSRWDLLDVVRACYTLQIPGIEWPKGQDGKVSFKLENLSQANGLLHEQAHDALSDVYATIALAKHIKQVAPEWFEQFLQLRHKRYVASQLNLEQLKPFIHVSGMFPVEQGCMSVMVPVAYNPKNRNAVICWNLLQDPQALLSADVSEIKQRVFTPKEQLTQDRLELKQVHLNRSPIVLPMTAMTPKLAEHWQLNGDQLRQNLKVLRDHCQDQAAYSELVQKVSDAFSDAPGQEINDPDLMLYSGGFFSEHDKREMKAIREASPEQLHLLSPCFEDERLDEMLFRYRARNYPDTLSEAESRRWEGYRHNKLLSEQSSLGLGFTEYAQKLEMLGQKVASEKEAWLIQELVTYGEAIYPFSDSDGF